MSFQAASQQTFRYEPTCTCWICTKNEPNMSSLFQKGEGMEGSEAQFQGPVPYPIRSASLTTFRLKHDMFTIPNTWTPRQTHLRIFDCAAEVNCTRFGRQQTMSVLTISCLYSTPERTFEISTSFVKSYNRQLDGNELQLKEFAVVGNVPCVITRISIEVQNPGT